MTTATEPRYTLAEAVHELARRECGAHGHDYQVIDTPAGPIRLICDRNCGAGPWSVLVPKDGP